MQRGGGITEGPRDSAGWVMCCESVSFLIEHADINLKLFDVQMRTVYT